MIEYTIEEARSLRHNYVGTEHLLLGLLRETEGVAAQVLMNLGLKLEVVRAEVLNLLGATPPDAPSEPEIVQIPKALNPKKSGVYGVSDLTPADSPGPPATLADRDCQIVRDLIRKLDERKEALVMEQEFEQAVQCRDEALALKRLLAFHEWFSNHR